MDVKNDKYAAEKQYYKVETWNIHTAANAACIHKLHI